MTVSEEEILNILDTFKDFDFLKPIFEDTRVDEFAVFLFNKGWVFNYDYGTTKLVICPLHKDYVIKIPFGGYYDLGDRLHRFEEADIDNEWDYCKVEYERYKNISESIFKDCFAETIFIGLANNYPIYLQEKCIPYNNTYKKSQKKTLSMEHFLSKSSIDLECINASWCIDLLRYYGAKKFKEFLTLIKKIGWDDDLGYDNVGYKNGHPIIIDFSGFREEQDQNEILDTILSEL